MNILITSIVDLKKSQHNRPHQLVKHLSKRHDITVLSINDWWKGQQDNLQKYSRDFENMLEVVDYLYITDMKISPLIQEVFSQNKVNKIINKNDFDVHLNYSTLVSGYFAAKRLKTVYDIADDLVGMIKESPQIPSPLRVFGEALGNSMIQKNIGISDQITVTTENLRKIYKIPENKSKIISNGVDIEQFKNHKDGNVFKEKLNLKGFILGYVGVLREWVDFEPLFSIMKDLNKDIKIVIVGKEGRFRETVMLAKKYNLDQRVIFTGMVPYSQVPYYISAMDVCLIPFGMNKISDSAVPLKLFEYMACEKPIISTKLSSVQNIVGERIFYFTNRYELKERIEELFEDEKLRENMGKEGRKFVEENHDWQKIVFQIEKLITDL